MRDVGFPMSLLQACVPRGCARQAREHQPYHRHHNHHPRSLLLDMPLEHSEVSVASRNQESFSTLAMSVTTSL